MMITGFLTIPNNENNKMYDYCGCLYPEGVISSEQTLVFNHEQISQVYHIGLVDDEEKVFKEKLNKLVSNIQINHSNDQIDNSYQDNVESVEDIIFEELN